MPDRSVLLGNVNVGRQPQARDITRGKFTRLRTNQDLSALRSDWDEDLLRTPDKTLALVGEMPAMRHHGHGSHVAEATSDGIEWEDTMADMNRASTPDTMLWKLVDQDSGAVNHEIAWAFETGDRIKLRIVNDPGSDHPMQHPFHIHGERFLVLSRNGRVNDNLAWKDSVLIRTGETVDLLVEMANPGTWMAHCHIAEHMEGGMMFNFRVGVGSGAHVHPNRNHA
jgi:FtsP/CotA-like multicopper oxidase with cupredoxin domain